jgi:hypothetical protein
MDRSLAMQDVGIRTVETREYLAAPRPLLIRSLA